jgi:3-oxoacyl-[acyl-carrier protein] reductase
MERRMNGMLDGQVAVITGSGRGIGASAARLMAREGAKVVLSDIDPAPAEDVAAEIKTEGGEAIVHAGDVTDPAFPDALMKAAADAFGKITILVNNAGFTWDGVLHKMDNEQWQAILDCHLTAPFRMIRASVPYMREAAKAEMGSGEAPQPRCIINVSSTSGLHGNAGQINYAAAKMGIVGLTKTVAKEWGQFNIRCNAVAYGSIATRMTAAKQEGETTKVGGREVSMGVPQHMLDMLPMVVPLGRAGTPDEAGGGMVLLASPYASYITGHTLEVTGGMGI